MELFFLGIEKVYIMQKLNDIYALPLFNHISVFKISCMQHQNKKL